jgi:hypothetical protein
MIKCTIRIPLLFRLILLVLLTQMSKVAICQETGNKSDQVYSFDPLLYNGKVYYFFPRPGTIGTQYLLDSFDPQGSLTVRGVTYSDLTLNYDIYNQKLVLKYKNPIGSLNFIEISFAWLEKFEIGGKQFEILATVDTTKQIYQVIGTGQSRILFFLSKKLRIENLTESSDHFFARTQKEMYVFDVNKRVKYNNNRSFVRAFNQALHDPISKYIRKHKLKVQKANDMQMNELINYCNTLTGT